MSSYSALDPVEILLTEVSRLYRKGKFKSLSFGKKKKEKEKGDKKKVCNVLQNVFWNVKKYEISQLE